MEFLPPWLLAAWLVAVIIRHQMVRSEAVRSHPPVPYEAAAGPDAWRWGTPPEGTALKVTHHAAHSRVGIPVRRSAVSYVGPLFGWLLLATAAVLLVVAVFVDPPQYVPRAIRLAFPLFPALLGLAALYADNHVVAVDLSPAAASVTVGYGAFLAHRVTLTRDRLSAQQQVAGAVQSGWAMNTYQELPDYYLRLNGRGLFRRDRRFVLHVNPTDGAWITDGLRFWAAVRPS